MPWEHSYDLAGRQPTVGDDYGLGEWYTSPTLDGSVLQRILRAAALDIGERLKVPEELQLTEQRLREDIHAGRMVGKKLNRRATCKFYCDTFDNRVEAKEMPHRKFGEVQYLTGTSPSPSGKILAVANRVLGEMIEASIVGGDPFTCPRAHVVVAGYAVEFFFYTHILEKA